MRQGLLFHSKCQVKISIFPLLIGFYHKFKFTRITLIINQSKHVFLGLLWIIYLPDSMKGTFMGHSPNKEGIWMLHIAHQSDMQFIQPIKDSS